MYSCVQLKTHNFSTAGPNKLSAVSDQPSGKSYQRSAIGFQFLTHNHPTIALQTASPNDLYELNKLYRLNEPHELYNLLPSVVQEIGFVYLDLRNSSSRSNDEQ